MYLQNIGLAVFLNYENMATLFAFLVHVHSGYCDATVGRRRRYY